MVVCKTRYMEHTWSKMYTVYGMRQRRRKFFSHDLKKFPKPRFSGALELRGEGGGVRGGPPPHAGMKIKASPFPPNPNPPTHAKFPKCPPTAPQSPQGMLSGDQCCPQD